MKKLIYSVVCLGGFGIAYYGLRISGSALLGIAGIMVCMYGLLEAMHAFSEQPKSAKRPKGKSMYAAITPDEMFPPISCPHCGADVPAGNEFCGKCGKKINE